MMTKKDQPLLAVFIDADNIPAKHAAAILKEIARYGEPALRRVYGDWGSDSLKNWRKQVRALGMVAQQETANTAGKNASDIGLVIDAMDILHKGKFDGFVIVSSDSDFTALANRIREDGVKVIGIGEKKASESLRNVCNRFVLIENIVDSEVSHGSKTSSGKDEAVGKRPKTKVVPLVLKAMKDTEEDDEWYRLAEVGSLINRANPDFDVRTYGSTKLSELISQTGHFQVRQKDGQFKIRLKPKST